MSYVRVEGSDLRTTGTYCDYQGGVGTCITNGVTVSGSNLVTIITETIVHQQCPRAVYYEAGNLILGAAATCIQR